jgi:PilZ domain
MLQLSGRPLTSEVHVSDDNRRVSERVDATVVVELDRGRHGVTRNVSGTGLLIATRSPFSPGDRLDLTLHTSSGKIRTGATVIRLDETPPQEPWRYRIAVQLDLPLPADVIEHGAEVAARLLGRASSIPPRA